jgi:hypothetical protein
MEDEFEIFDDAIGENEEFRYSITSYGMIILLEWYCKSVERKNFCSPISKKICLDSNSSVRFVNH